MKTCLLCGKTAPSDALTCAACGEGTFSVVVAKAAPVAAVAPAIKPVVAAEPGAVADQSASGFRRGKR